ncbi:usherin-like isoform X1 [Rhinatrema bivittatum]|uniref:usherin-like isoform X1 n=1 Tax=Rhinatrema bivittatum TaxID=194408 RepID=UPI001128F6D9|nr:usherin-like isoform X1 [Rhinatrema bivittatum]XP_029452616.1 usherin-like isoform X1 [Rhinatrema bivittatum]XP_029452617.1 usherin-like isoform X1 [Rhinatrema bivittatum]
MDQHHYAKEAFFFQISCRINKRSIRTPVIRYSTATGLGSIQEAPAEKNGTKPTMTPFYTELWFITLMCGLGLILLAIFLSLILKKKLSMQSYARERPPLVPLQKRMVPASVYSPNETYTFDPIAAISDASGHITLKSYTMHVEDLTETKVQGSDSHISNQSGRNMSILRIPSQSQLSLTYSQNSLQLGASQFIDFHDRKSLIEDSVWDTIIHSRNSGMYTDEDLISTIKGFSTVTQEHTTFTDTPL